MLLELGAVKPYVPGGRRVSAEGNTSHISTTSNVVLVSLGRLVCGRTP
jgi:hypothetical protein